MIYEKGFGKGDEEYICKYVNGIRLKINKKYRNRKARSSVLNHLSKQWKNLLYAGIVTFSLAAAYQGINVLNDMIYNKSVNRQDVRYAYNEDEEIENVEEKNIKVDEKYREILEEYNDEKNKDYIPSGRNNNDLVLVTNTKNVSDVFNTHYRFERYKELFEDLERYMGLKKYILSGVAFNESRMFMNRVSRSKAYGISQIKYIAYKEVLNYKLYKKIIDEYNKKPKLRKKNKRKYELLKKIYEPFVKAVERERRMYGWKKMPSFQKVKSDWRSNIVFGSLYYYFCYLNTKEFEIKGNKVVYEKDADVIAYLLYNKGIARGKKVLRRIYKEIRRPIEIGDVLNYLYKKHKLDESSIGLNHIILWYNSQHLIEMSNNNRG